MPAWERVRSAGRIIPSLIAAALVSTSWLTSQQPVAQTTFERDVLPILADRCQPCHNENLQLGELALDSADALQRGGSNGPALVPGSPLDSRLYRRAARLEEPFMPMEGEALTDREVGILKQWIEAGADWPTPQRRANEQAETKPAQPKASATQETVPSETEFFDQRVHPVLARCQSCHDEALKYAGLSLETPEGLAYGGLKGRAVVAGNPEASRLYRKAARLEPHFMPVSAVMLDEEEIAVLRRWIEQGAVWPDPTAQERARKRAEQTAKLKPFEDKPIQPAERDWWAFRKPVRPPVPEVRGRDRETNPIDAFLLAARQEKGLQAAPPAARATLLRRVYLDLIGLPPTPEQREQFLADDSPDAYERLVDRLLESRHYGERWARHWLDVVRYADSDGYEYDKLRPHAWRYRDYVIRAFNEDKPYDRFIIEQLAGDELPDRNQDSITALGFCRNGPFIGDMAFMQNEQTRQDELDDIVSTVGGAFLGLTVGCARCHDHKYDPLRQKDYYSMVAVFAPSIRDDTPLAPPELSENYDRRMTEIDREIEGLKYRVYKLHEPTRERLLQAKYRELSKTLRIAVLTSPESRTEAQTLQAKEVRSTVVVPEEEILPELSEEEKKKTEEWKAEIERLDQSRPSLPLAQAITESEPDVRPTYFLHRGNVRNKGSAVEPAAPAVLAPPGQDLAFPPRGLKGGTSGRRLTLARWIASADNPLTARVMVNRIWRHHFGRGIVTTPNNFGKTGEPPTHPALLDWLAAEFIDRGWSVKAIHRLIIKSRAYRQASAFTSEVNQRVDPGNRMLWKMPLIRLEGEIIRDSVLAVSGALNREAGGPAVFPEVDAGIIDSSPKGGDYQRWPETKDGPARWKRSVYVAQMRTITPPLLDLFDPPDKLASCPARSVTTVPTQALQLLNNPFIVRQARLFAERVRNEAGADPRRQASRAFLLGLSRPPSAVELDNSLSFLGRQKAYHQRHNRELAASAVDPARILSPEMGALTDLCHAMFNLNEFVYPN